MNSSFQEGGEAVGNLVVQVVSTKLLITISVLW